MLIPQAVATEVSEYRRIDFQDFGFIIKPDLQHDIALCDIQRIFCLHKGEVAAISIALQNAAFVFLTDDAAARLAAQQFRIEAHGTIGVLLRAVRRRQRTPQQIRNVLENLIMKSSLHIKGDLVDLALRQLAQLG